MDRPRNWLRLVTMTNPPVPGNSGRTCSASLALSSRINARIPESVLRSSADRSST
jgi:hypothetical protein